MFREGIISLLKNEENIAIIGEVRNGIEALAFMEENVPDIILMDIEMPEMDGLKATGNIRKKYPSVKIIALTMHKRSAFIKHMLKAGASGFVLKNSGKKELVTAIEAVHNGETHYTPDVMRSVMDSIRGKEEKNETPLSSREIEIIKLIASEMTTPEIATKLHLSPLTVETHRKNILVKLGLRNVAGIVRYAFTKGWMDAG
jgi:DNA-binding NarL/FixJ family response regulator